MDEVNLRFVRTPRVSSTLRVLLQKGPLSMLRQRDEPGHPGMSKLAQEMATLILIWKMPLQED